MATHGRFGSLDGLRGVAALMVFFGHAGTVLGYSGWRFEIAVDLFFMISGFVIPFSYEAKLRAGMTLGQFMRVRLIRVYPLYILGVALSLCAPVFWTLHDLQPWHLRAAAHQLPWAILLLPEPHLEPNNSFMLNPAAWSLFLELVINVAYCLALPRLTTRVVAWLAGLSTVALGVAIAHFGTVDFGTGGVEMLWGLTRVTCPFSIGVLLYRLWRAGRLPAWRLHPVAGGGLFLLMTIALSRSPGGLWDLVAVAVACPLIVTLAIGSPAGGKSAKAIHWAGELSYPLYMLHLPLIMIPRQLFGVAGVDPWWLTLGTLPLVLVVAAAAIPPDRLIRRWLLRSQKAFRPLEPTAQLP